MDDIIEKTLVCLAWGQIHMCCAKWEDIGSFDNWLELEREKHDVAIREVMRLKGRSEADWSALTLSQAVSGVLSSLCIKNQISDVVYAWCILAGGPMEGSAWAPVALYKACADERPWAFDEWGRWRGER